MSERRKRSSSEGIDELLATESAKPPPVPGEEREAELRAGVAELTEQLDDVLDSMTDPERPNEASGVIEPDRKTIGAPDDAELEEISDDDILEFVSEASRDDGRDAARSKAIRTILGAVADGDGAQSAAARAELACEHLVTSDDSALAVARELLDGADTGNPSVLWARIDLALADPDHDPCPALEQWARASSNPRRRGQISTALGLEYAKRGLVNESRAALRRALSEDRMAILPRLLLARSTASDNSPDELAGYLEGLATQTGDPQLRGAFAALAVAALADGGEDKRARTLVDSLSVSPSDSSMASYALDRLVGETPQGIADIRQREATATERPSDWLDAGLLQAYVARDHATAVKNLRRAAEKADGVNRALILWELLAQALVADDKQSQLDAVEGLLASDYTVSERVELLCRKAELLVAQDQRDEAANIYDQALEEDSRWGPALEGAGRLFFAMQDDSRLLRMHQLEADAAVDDRDRAHALRRLGEILVRDQSTFARGLGTLRTANELAVGDRMVFAALSDALRLAEEWFELDSLIVQQISVAEDPAWQAWLLAERAAILTEHLRSDEQAIVALEGLVKLEYTPPPYALTQLARLLERNQHWKRLAAVLEELAELTSTPGERATFLERQANAYEQLGQTDKAVASYHRAVATAPPSHPVFGAAGRAFLRAKLYEELIDLFESAAAKSDNRRKAKWKVRAAEVALDHLDDIERASALLAEAVELDPESRRAQRQMADALWRAGQWQEYRKRVEPAGHRGTLRMAALADAAGDSDEACRHYAQLIEDGVTIVARPYLRILSETERWGELVELTEKFPEYGVVGGYAAFQHLGNTERACALWSAAAKTGDVDGQVALACLAPFDQLEDIPLSSGDDPLACAVQRICLESDMESDSIAELDSRSPVVSSDPVLAWRVDQRLRGAGGNHALERLELIQSVLCPTSDGWLTAPWRVHSVDLLRNLGRTMDAVSLAQAALFVEADDDDAAAISFALGLRLLALARDQDDLDLAQRVLGRMALRAPAPWSGTLFHVIADLVRISSGDDEARKALVVGLEHCATDYSLLADLLDACAVDSSVPLAPLQRAIEKEQHDERAVELGFAMVERLKACGRADAAVAVTERVSALAPDDARVRRLRIERRLAAGERNEAFDEARALLDDQNTAEALRAACLEDLLELVELDTLDDNTRSALHAAATSLPLSPFARHLAVELFVSGGHFAVAKRNLEQLIEDQATADSARLAYLLVLASICEDHLDDPGAAIHALARAAQVGDAVQALDRVMALGEKSGRWDIAADALRSAIDNDTIDVPWQVALRRRLAEILSLKLDRVEDAVEEYQKILVSDPDDVETLERMVHALAGNRPDEAIRFACRILALAPTNESALRQLRELYAKTGQADGAFLCDAVLVGFDRASDEALYFYRQKRTTLPSEFSKPLSVPDLKTLFPEANDPAVRLLRALQPHLAAVFPADFAAYGAESSGDQPRSVEARADDVVRFFGGSNVKASLIAGRLAPCVERGSEPVLMVPRTLLEVPVREQNAVIAPLVARVLFAGVGADPAGQTAVEPAHFAFFVEAALAHVDDDYQSPHDQSLIFKDIFLRLGAAMSASAKSVVAEVAGQIIDSGVDEALASATTAIRAAEARAAWLCAVDPAAAISTMNEFSLLLGDIDAETGMAVAFLDALPFAVSPEHVALRQRLGLAVQP